MEGVVVNIDDEIDAVQAETSAAVVIKPPSATLKSNLRRRIVISGVSTLTIILFIVASAIIQVYTCWRQLRLLNDHDALLSDIRALLLLVSNAHQ